jgi:putative spermidine/putrescine transport system substrate-binding protein
MRLRGLLAAAVTAALVGTAAPAAMADHAKDRATITFFIWAGSNQGVVPMEVINAYKAKNPHVTIEILESNNAITYPRMVAAKRTTPDSPLVHCGFFNVDIMNRGDVDEMWEPMDPAKIPNMGNVLTNFVRPENKGVGYQMSGIGILYNKNRVQTPPTSWATLWDPANRGRVVMFDYDTRMIAIAARLNGGSEAKADPGFKVWGDNARNFRALVDSNDGVKNLLVSGDAWYAPWFSSLANVWIAEGAPLGFAVPKEGAIAFPVYLGVVKGVTPAQRAVCEDLINTLLEPQNSGRYGALTFAIPVVKNAAMSPEQLANPMLNLEVAEKSVLLDYALISQLTADWRERWDREVKTKMR